MWPAANRMPGAESRQRLRISRIDQSENEWLEPLPLAVRHVVLTLDHERGQDWAGAFRVVAKVNQLTAFIVHAPPRGWDEAPSRHRLPASSSLAIGAARGRAVRRRLGFTTSSSTATVRRRRCENGTPVVYMAKPPAARALPKTLKHDLAGRAGCTGAMFSDPGCAEALARIGNPSARAV
jgi:hypothetical protein